VARTFRSAGAAALLAGALALGSCARTVHINDSRPFEVLGEKPARKPARVFVRKDRIEIDEKIHFDFDKATIKPESHGLLDEVVAVIQKNPQIRRLSIEGHTDSDGPEPYNQGLSERRAASVREYLVGHGVAGEMLIWRGHGESRPLTDNASSAGKENNRRVEFIITEQEEVNVEMEVDPRTGERRLIGQQGATEPGR
jgi:OOP family OmpA-OmpF porin